MPEKAVCPHCDSVIDAPANKSAGMTCPLCAEAISGAILEGQSPEWIAKRVQSERGPPRGGKRGAKSGGDAQVVFDTVIGPNLRLKDNVIQALSVLGGIVLGAGIGALVVEERIAGALGGGFLGMILGLFLSGIVLMIYRMFRH